MMNLKDQIEQVLMSSEQVEKAVPLCPRMRADYVKRGLFPKPVTMPGGKKQFWKSSEIQNFIAELGGKK